MKHPDTFSARSTLKVGSASYTIFRLAALRDRSRGNVDRLPFSLKILLENLLRGEDGAFVKPADIEALAAWDVTAGRQQEVAFRTSRVLLQDFTGVPCVVDLAAMRDAIVSLGGDATLINPLQPVDLVIDHSVQVDQYGVEAALLINTNLEFERNRERYEFLRWGQNAFGNFRVVPPGTGICHQVNLEYLGRVVFTAKDGSDTVAYPDSLVGTDSHTTMINGLGVMGWGVGGIEAEAAMLGQPVSMLIPEVVGFRLHGRLPTGATATDLVLTVTEMLRRKKVVGKFVEFFGPGLSSLSLADRATIANMSPEYGATMGFFPVDAETLKYLRLTARDEAQVQLVEAYCREQGIFRTDETPDPVFTDSVELDLSTVVPSLAGPKRPQDRIPLSKSKEMFQAALKAERARLVNAPVKTAAVSETPVAAKVEGGRETTVAMSRMDSEGSAQAHEEHGVALTLNGVDCKLHHGSVVIAAITSCTNTSNPSVMLAAGLLARNAVKKGLKSKPWVKTSLAPGSKVVTEYFNKSGVMSDLEALGFAVVGYGCTTCIGNSGPLPEPVSKAIDEGQLVAAAVLSGNRNFEGRVNPQTRFNYLASPPLVVAYALAGRMDIDLEREPLGVGADGPVFLRDIWPAAKDVEDEILRSVKKEMFHDQYANVFAGDEEWRALPVPSGKQYAWSAKSTYVQHPPFFEGMTAVPPGIQPITGARVLGMYGDSITTDHISPAGSIAEKSPAGQWLIAQGVVKKDFNSYGSRRGNHQVMMRGTFANIRLRNELAGGKEGWWTARDAGGEPVALYDVAMERQTQGVPQLVIAGKEYGTGSSRDWAAKGTALLGVRAVIAESFERIHRSNLIGMGVIPLQFPEGETVKTLGLDGDETFDITGITELNAGRTPRTVKVTATKPGADAPSVTFDAVVRIDTPGEADYYRNGGIMQYVLRSLRAGSA
jgi:aconitate hydratase A / 2-methylisocitrate dehydratase